MLLLRRKNRALSGARVRPEEGHIASPLRRVRAKELAVAALVRYIKRRREARRLHREWCDRNLPWGWWVDGDGFAG